MRSCPWVSSGQGAELKVLGPVVAARHKLLGGPVVPSALLPPRKEQHEELVTPKSCARDLKQINVMFTSGECPGAPLQKEASFLGKEAGARRVEATPDTSTGQGRGQCRLWSPLILPAASPGC